MLERLDAVDWALVIAFDHRHIRRIKECTACIKGAINYSGRLVDPLHAGRAARADILNQSWLYCDRDLCEEAHAARAGAERPAGPPSIFDRSGAGQQYREGGGR